MMANYADASPLAGYYCGSTDDTIPAGTTPVMIEPDIQVP